MSFRQRPQSLRGLFRRQVALGLGQHLVANHELLHGGRAQQGGIEMGVKLPVPVVTAGFHHVCRKGLF